MTYNFDQMSDQEVSQVASAAQRMLALHNAREDLIAFVKLTMPDPDDHENVEKSQYQDAAHHRLIAHELEQVAKGDLLRLALAVGPQHGKTQLTSKHFIAWYIGKFPHRNVIFATYNETYAREIGDDVRAVMLHPIYKHVFPGVELRAGSKAKDMLKTTKGGKLAFIGRGGSGSGKPADLLVIDDPLKNAEEADSPTIIRQLHDWFSKVAYARCHVGTAIVIIHTRWVEDDLIGRLVDEDHPEHDPEIAAPWEFINIPAVITDPKLADTLGLTLEVQTDPMVKKEFGDAPMSALWPLRFPLKHLATAKRINPRGFNALYMGRPAPEDGDYFKKDWLVEYNPHELPKNLRKYGASDHAVTEKQQNDPNVIGCVGVDENDDIWVLPDLVWERMETDRTVEELMAQMVVHRPLTWWMEDEVISKAFGPFLRKRMNEEKVYTLIDGKTPSRDKRTRARSIQGRVAMRKVHFPCFAAWWPEAKAQMLKFPHAVHDDFVDWLAWIGLGLNQELAADAPYTVNDNRPATGTLEWIKWASKQRERRAAKAGRKGF